MDVNYDHDKCMLFSYNKNVIFKTIKIGNNKINETSVTIVLGILPDMDIL